MTATRQFYVVTGWTGEYSDHSEWHVAAYESKHLAELHRDAANIWADQNGVNESRIDYNTMSYERRGEVGPNPWDPHMRVDYTGVGYEISAVPAPVEGWRTLTEDDYERGE